MGDDGRRMRIKKLILRAAVLALIVVISLPFLESFAQIYLGASIFSPSWFFPEVRWWVYERLLLNRRASTILNALNNYYRDKGVYPPYVFGSTPEELDKYMIVDPLLEGGYLRAYPRRFIPGDSPSWAFKGLEPPPGGNHWMVNLASAPNDPLVQYLRRQAEKRMMELTGFDLEGNFQKVTEAPHPYYLRDHFGNDVEAGVEGWISLLKKDRFFLAGGVPLSYRDKLARELRWLPSITPIYARHWLLGYQVYADGSYVVLHLAELLHDGRGSESMLGHFGYQRGDYFGLDEKSCWLWFYGVRSPVLGREVKYPGSNTPTNAMVLYGLDIVDTANGQIRPDGIADGIVLVYKLREGKVIEVVKKYD